MKSTIIAGLLVLFASMAIIGQVEAQTTGTTVEVITDEGDTVQVTLTQEQINLARAGFIATGGVKAVKSKASKKEVAALRNARPDGFYTARALGAAAQAFADRHVLNTVGGDSTDVAWVAYQQARLTGKVRRASGETFVKALMAGATNGATALTEADVRRIASEEAERISAEKVEAVKRWAEGKFKTR